MKRLFFLAASCLTFCGCAATCADRAHWIWYPGDFEIYLAQEAQETRLEWGGLTPVMWPQYHHYPSVTFRKVVELSEDEDMTVTVDGRGRYLVAGIGEGGFVGREMTIRIPKGKTKIEFQIVNSKRVPSVYVRSASFVSDASWTVEHSNCGEQVAASCNGYLTDPSLAPADFKLATEQATPVATRFNGKGGLIADFGREMCGYPVFTEVQGMGRVRVVYGESEAEALADGVADEKLTQRSGAADVWENLDMTATASHRIPGSRAFRYINVVPMSGDVKIGGIRMDREYNADLKIRGLFACDNARLNEIWRVAEYTLGLTAREFLLDGIKRDRWAWCGDARQSALLSYYAYGEPEVVRRTLWALRGKEPVWRHINTISDYTFYWFEMIRDYYLYTGDASLVREIYPRMLSMMAFVEGRMDASDRGMYVTKPTDWTFIDWAPETLRNQEGPVALLQMLLVRAYEALSEAAGLMRDEPTRTAYAEKAAALRSRIVPTFWNEAKGGLVHALDRDGRQVDQFTRYANMFGVFYGYFDVAQTKLVQERCLLNDKVLPIVTPYMHFYELEAQCALGRQTSVTSDMLSYWGGMLDLGATTFWELYDPREKGEEHLAMYGRTYGRSLCHAWGASPIYLLGRYYLGVKPTAPGFSRYEVRPATGGLKWMLGTVPTPQGEITVDVRDGKVTVTGCAAGEGVLHWNGRSVAIPRNGSTCL